MWVRSVQDLSVWSGLGRRPAKGHEGLRMWGTPRTSHSGGGVPDFGHLQGAPRRWPKSGKGTGKIYEELQEFKSWLLRAIPRDPVGLGGTGGELVGNWWALFAPPPSRFGRLTL